MPTEFSAVQVRAGLYWSSPPVPRVHRHSDRRAQIDIAQPEHNITGIEDDALHVLNRVQPVDAADEFQIARTPRRIRTHAGHVFFDGQTARGIVQESGRCTIREGTVISSRGGRSRSMRRTASTSAPRSSRRGVEVNLERTNPRCQVDDSLECLLLHRRHEGVDPEPEFEIERFGTIFDQQVIVAGLTDFQSRQFAPRGIGQDRRLISAGASRPAAGTTAGVRFCSDSSWTRGGLRRLQRKSGESAPCPPASAGRFSRVPPPQHIPGKRNRPDLDRPAPE